MVNAVGSDKFFLPDTAAKKESGFFFARLVSGFCIPLCFQARFHHLAYNKKQPVVYNSDRLLFVFSLKYQLSKGIPFDNCSNKKAS